MSERQEIIANLRRFIIDDLFVPITPEELDVEKGLGAAGVDSLGFLELSAFIEEQYRIKVAGDEFVPKNFRTLNLLADYIQTKQEAVPAG